MIHIRLFSFLIVFLGLLSFTASAQVQFHPVPRHPDYFSPVRGARLEDDDTDTFKLKLPFYDDFSTSKDQPDTTRWKKNGGVYVNNTMGIAPPSFNVATFDGLDYTGKPYDFESVTRAGDADHLTSRMIDLGASTANDRLYFSFFWQSQGRGEKPDADDHIRLEFKDKTGNWVEQWRKAGGTEATPFEFVILPVSDSRYLHREFRFRFVNYSRLSGPYDTWNIDYIYLNKDRDQTPSILDMAVSTQPISILKNYTAMPIKQFYANLQGEVRDSVTLTMNNLNSQFNVVSYDVELRDLVRKDRITVVEGGTQLLQGYARQQELKLKTRDSINRFREYLFPKNRPSMILQYKFRLNTKETDATIPGVKLTGNDTITGTTVIDNYYAYDDGSAEYAVSFSQKYGKIAYKFQLNVPDVLTHIDLNFVPVGTNLRGETFNLYVWRSINLTEKGGSSKDSILLLQNVLLTYPDTINQFRRIELGRQVPLQAGTFYIGIEQLTDKNLTIGFDRNMDASDKIYVNTTNEWIQYTKIKGSLLMRPVFGVNKPTGLDDKKWETLKVNVYPNPTTGLVVIDGEVEQATLIDQTGRVLFEKSFSIFEADKSISLDELPNGLYFLHLTNKQTRAVKKVVLNK